MRAVATQPQHLVDLDIVTVRHRATVSVHQVRPRRGRHADPLSRPQCIQAYTDRVISASRASASQDVTDGWVTSLLPGPDASRSGVDAQVARCDRVFETVRQADEGLGPSSRVGPAVKFVPSG
jgi:hypothetical protein